MRRQHAKLKIQKDGIETDHKLDWEVMEIVDNFIDKFCVTYHVLDNFKKPEELRRDEVDYSFIYNYILPQALLDSKHCRSRQDPNRDYIRMGFLHQYIQREFTYAMKGVTKDFLYVIQNHKHQEEYSDWRIEGLKRVDDKTIVDDWNFDGNKITPIKVEMNRTVITYTQTGRQPWDNTVSVEFLDDILNKIDVYKEGEKYLSVDKYDRPTVHGVKHCADVNEFLSSMAQVIFGIEDTLKEKTK